MRRLDDIQSIEQIQNFKHWVIDVQGAELNVIRGAEKLINECQSLQIEVKNISDYIGGSSWINVKDFLFSKGFKVSTVNRRISSLKQFDIRDEHT